MTSSQDRALGALIGLAVGDALGAPVEFKKRGHFPMITEMVGGGKFRLPPGAWTDDTAMALCLAESLLVDPDLDLHDLMSRFLRWIDSGEPSSTGRAVGLGQNTFWALADFRKSGEVVARLRSKPAHSNGALMRLAPLPCMHWRDPSRAMRLARLAVTLLFPVPPRKECTEMICPMGGAASVSWFAKRSWRAALRGPFGTSVMARPPQGTVSERWLNNAADYCQVLIGLGIPLLLAAAFVEAYITPLVILWVFGT